MSKKENKTGQIPAEKIHIDDECIQIGNVKLSNVDLKSIVRKSEEISLFSEEDAVSEELKNNPQFMKSLNAYATEKSKEIIDSTVCSEDVKKNKASPSEPAESTESVQTSVTLAKPATSSVNVQIVKKDAPKANKNEQFLARQSDQKKMSTTEKNRKKDRKLINPSGEDSAFFAKPVNIEELGDNPEDLPENFRIRKQNLLPMELSRLFQEQPNVIARHFLLPNFPFSFQFILEVHFGLTGIVRQTMYSFSGMNTFNAMTYIFKHRYCESENFQWFYLSHTGKLMEVRDTLSLKQMLVAHGAFPKGVNDIRKAHGKILCIPRCSQTEDEIFEREADLIMGLANQNLTKQEDALVRHLLFQIAPDIRYAPMFHATVTYSDEQIDNPYNQYDDILQLILFCQRHLDSEEIFQDPRTQELTENDLKSVLVTRYQQPYKNCSKLESVNLEVQSILDQLRKSKHQTKEAYDHIEVVLKQQVQKLIK